MKNLFAYRLSQLNGHYLFTVLASARPCTLFYCITVLQAFGNLGLLAGYGAKPIGPGLGRDKDEGNTLQSNGLFPVYSAIEFRYKPA